MASIKEPKSVEVGFSAGELLGAAMPIPQPANWFAVNSTPTSEIQLLMGYVDVTKVQLAASYPVSDPLRIPPELTHRIVLNKRGLELLRRALETAAKALESGESQPDMIAQADPTL